MDRAQPPYARSHTPAPADDAATLSPWTGIGSPASSSDFEAISDTEVGSAAAAFSAAQPPQQQGQQQQYDRAPRGRMHSYGASSSSRERPFAPPTFSFSSSASFSRGRRTADEDDAHRRGIEGDDEDSSAFEGEAGEEGGRGWRRTRRRDPELKRSMPEEALRSSLATLLSLAPGQPSAMSQTPSISYANLSALFTSSAAKPAAGSTPSSPFSTSNPSTSASSASTFSRPSPAPPTSATLHPPGHRPSPFASALEDQDDEGLEHLPHPGSSYDDPFLTSSASSSDDADATELGIGIGVGFGAAGGSVPITISRSRSSGGREGEEEHYSPLQPSRPLGASPPSSRSNRRPLYGLTERSERGAYGRGRSRRGRGRGASSSLSPGPASAEERRRARERAREMGWGSASAAVGGGESRGRGGTGTDVEEGRVERDEAFAELLDAARFFSDLSPRQSRRASAVSASASASIPSSQPSSYDSTRTLSSFSALTQPLFPSSASFVSPRQSAGREEEDEDGREGEDSDPALRSESVPGTVEGLSSSGTYSRAGSGEGDSAEKDKEGRKEEKEKGKEKKPRRGFLGWLKGLGSAVVEIKLWQMVGICGLLVGVGLGAGTLIRSLAISTPILDFLHLSPSASLFPLSPDPAASLIRIPPRTARFNSGVEDDGRMGGLFL
ncbi:hypothetical protein JCM8097_005731 [Rhodosporidiobolus ruineniae]